MTELFGFAALAVGGYWIAKRVKRKMADVEQRLSEMAARPDQGDVKSLIKDPATGRYRPAD
ncbi:MAG: hypothetical protein JJ902_03255 [Roseibium sp.]|nr:hypothetical protein [Roseibium sp.]